MGKRKDGITSLTRLRLRCSIADRTDPECCWIWKGCDHNGCAAIWVVIEGKGKVVTAPRAALMLTGETIPPRWRTWTSCKDPMCCNPRHAVRGTALEWGAWVREHGLFTGNAKLISSQRANGRKKSKIDRELALEIRSSPLTPTKEAKRLSETLGQPFDRRFVAKVRRPNSCWAEPNPFSGLGAR